LKRVRVRDRATDECQELWAATRATVIGWTLAGVAAVACAAHDKDARWIQNDSAANCDVSTDRL
jgi:hypothetical protein